MQTQPGPGSAEFTTFMRAYQDMVFSTAARLVPPPWWYFGLSACALLYVMSFGLGAAAYRTL